MNQESDIERLIHDAAQNRAKRLSLRDLGIKELPNGVAKIGSLELLDLRNNNLADLPSDLVNLTRLKKIEISHNCFEEIPTVINKLTALEQLLAEANRLDARAISSLATERLKELVLSYNPIRSLANNFRSASSLTRLIMRDIQIDEGSLEWLPANLVELEISRNRISALPEFFQQFTSLRQLSLEANDITSLPQWLPRLEALFSLNLRKNRLTSIPNELGGFRHITKLQLGANQLVFVPPEISSLHLLEQLDLGGNRLTDFPEAIDGLRRLQHLNLGGNHIQMIPAGTTFSETLQFLDLAGNGLHFVPLGVFKCKFLEKLNLGNNALTELPTELGNLERLTHLDIRNNQLKELPDAIIKLHSLKHLHLSGNPLALPRNLLIDSTNVDEVRRAIARRISLPVSRAQASKKYDFVISFASEDRAHAKAIATQLRKLKVPVFYDEFEQAELLGKNLITHLHEKYRSEARYCLMLCSVHYVTKKWTRVEREAAQDRAFYEPDSDYILPIHIDDTDIPGLPRTIAHLDILLGVERICEILLEKLSRSIDPPSIP